MPEQKLSFDENWQLLQGLQPRKQEHTRHSLLSCNWPARATPKLISCGVDFIVVGGIRTPSFEAEEFVNSTD